MNPPSSAVPAAAPQPQQPAQGQTVDPSEFGDYSEWAKENMDKGLSADQLKQTLAQNGIQLNQPQQGGSDPNSWWKSLLPAAGGVLGGILGGGADVLSLGALAPLINPITGAALGGAGGQALENGLEGKDVVQGNLLSSGVENGLGELVGMGAGKLVGALGEGMVGAGAKAGEKAAMDAEKVAGKAAALTDQKATELNFGGISEPMQKTLKLGDSQDFVREMGMDHTDPRELQKVSTAGNYLNNVYDRALANSSPVDMSDAGKLLGVEEGGATTGLTDAEKQAAAKMGITSDTLSKATVQGGDAAATGQGSVYASMDRKSPVGQALADFNKGRGAAPNAVLPEQLNATEVRKLQQAVGRQIGNLQKTVNAAQLNGKYDADLIGQLQDLNELYGKLGAKIKTPEVNDAIASLKVTGADRQGLIKEYGDKLGNHIADTITNAKTADDLLGPMQHFKRMSDTADMALEDITQARGTPRATKRVEFQQNGGIAPGSASSGRSTLGDVVEAGANAVHKPVGTVVSVARRLHEAGVTPKIAKGLGNIIKRTAPLVAPATVVGSNIPNISTAMQGNGSAVPGDNTMQPTSATPAAAPVNPVNSTVDSLLWSLGRPGASLTPGYGAMVSGLNALAPSVQNNELAANTAKELAPTFGNAGGAQGLGGGLINMLLSKVPGTAANTYDQQKLAAATQIAKLLGITPQAALAMFPQLAQTQNVAAPQEAATSGLVGTLTAGLPQ